MSCAHKSMNAGQSAEEGDENRPQLSPTAPRLWKIFVADGTSTKLSCAFEGGSTEATAILEGQAERPAAGLNHCFPSLLPHSASASRLTANALEFSILS